VIAALNSRADSPARFRAINDRFRAKIDKLYHAALLATVSRLLGRRVWAIHDGRL
jgi:hypothetical protein